MDYNSIAIEKFKEGKVRSKVKCVKCKKRNVKLDNNLFIWIILWESGIKFEILPWCDKCKKEECEKKENYQCYSESHSFRHSQKMSKIKYRVKFNGEEICYKCFKEKHRRIWADFKKFPIINFVNFFGKSNIHITNYKLNDRKFHETGCPEFKINYNFTTRSYMYKNVCNIENGCIIDRYPELTSFQQQFIDQFRNYEWYKEYQDKYGFLSHDDEYDEFSIPDEIYYKIEKRKYRYVKC